MNVPLIGLDRVKEILGVIGLNSSMSRVDPPMTGQDWEDKLDAITELADEGFDILSGKESAAQMAISARNSATGNNAKPASPPESPTSDAVDLQARVQELERALELILPMAKGYAIEHDVGVNKRLVDEATWALAGAKP